jgi:hypothetical protein
MPLPCDVGEALAAYLSQTRPATARRQVFLAAKAPVRAIPPGLVSDPAPGRAQYHAGPLWRVRWVPVGS